MKAKLLVEGFKVGQVITPIDDIEFEAVGGEIRIPFDTLLEVVEVGLNYTIIRILGTAEPYDENGVLTQWGFSNGYVARNFAPATREQMRRAGLNRLKEDTSNPFNVGDVVTWNSHALKRNYVAALPVKKDALFAVSITGVHKNSVYVRTITPLEGYGAEPCAVVIPWYFLKLAPRDVAKKAGLDLLRESAYFSPGQIITPKVAIKTGWWGGMRTLVPGELYIVLPSSQTLRATYVPLSNLQRTKLLTVPDWFLKNFSLASKQDVLAQAKKLLT